MHFFLLILLFAASALATQSNSCDGSLIPGCLSCTSNNGYGTCQTCNATSTPYFINFKYKNSDDDSIIFKACVTDCPPFTIADETDASLFTCTECSDGCSSCAWNDQGNTTCLTCGSRYFDELATSGTCTSCDTLFADCVSCGLDTDNVTPTCYACLDGMVLNGTDCDGVATTNDVNPLKEYKNSLTFQNLSYSSLSDPIMADEFETTLKKALFKAMKQGAYNASFTYEPIDMNTTTTTQRRLLTTSSGTIVNFTIAFVSEEDATFAANPYTKDAAASSIASALSAYSPDVSTMAICSTLEGCLECPSSNGVGTCKVCASLTPYFINHQYKDIELQLVTRKQCVVECPPFTIANETDTPWRCVSCPDGCSSCTLSDDGSTTICSDCGARYYEATTDPLTCESCDIITDGCASCDGVVCRSCEVGMTWNDTSSTCEGTPSYSPSADKQLKSWIKFANVDYAEFADLTSETVVEFELKLRGALMKIYKDSALAATFTYAPAVERRRSLRAVSQPTNVTFVIDFPTAGQATQAGSSDMLNAAADSVSATMSAFGPDVSSLEASSGSAATTGGSSSKSSTALGVGLGVGVGAAVGMAIAGYVLVAKKRASNKVVALV